MFTAQVGNLLELIEELTLDGIMNAANGRGPMGRGIAGAIRNYGGDEIMDDAFAVCNSNDPLPGQAYSTISGRLKDRGIKRIIHAVTMKDPGGYTDYDIVRNAFMSAIHLAKMEGITRFGCTALSTGVGGLDAERVGAIMGGIALGASFTSPIEICFVDMNIVFVNTLNDVLADYKKGACDNGSK